MNASRILFVAGLIVLAACSSPKKDQVTVGTSTSDGTVTNSQSTTIQTDKGSVTIGKTDATKLGAPVYPGATANENGSVSVSGQGDNAAMASFKTTDDFDKVYQFYKAQMPAGSEKMKMTMGDTSTAMFAIGDGKDPKAATTSVQIQGKAGETDVIITHTDAKP